MIKYRLEYTGLRFVVFFVNLLPLFVINATTALLGSLVWILFPFRLPVAYHNISTIFPTKPHSDKLFFLKKAYRHFFYAAGLILVIHRKKMVEMIPMRPVKYFYRTLLWQVNSAADTLSFNIIGP